MFRLLNELKDKICIPGPQVDISGLEIDNLRKKSVVVLPAGGEGTRMRQLTEAQGLHKVVLRPEGGESLIQRIVEMYRDAGLTEFVALIYYEGESVVNDLGDGSSLGVKITYSQDPGGPVGRGGAILNAMENGILAQGSTLIVHNPDDQIVRYSGSFPDDILKGHLQGAKEGAVATAVVVPETPYSYTGFKIESGKIRQIAAYPPVPIPAHTGVTVLGPETFSYFREIFDLSKKMDFEPYLFPKLVEEDRLYSVIIPSQCWIAVNDLKGLRAYLEAVERKE